MKATGVKNRKGEDKTPGTGRRLFTAGARDAAVIKGSRPFCLWSDLYYYSREARCDKVARGGGREREAGLPCLAGHVTETIQTRKSAARAAGLRAVHIFHLTSPTLLACDWTVLQGFAAPLWYCTVAIASPVVFKQES
jgi:hypothetical protein